MLRELKRRNHITYLTLDDNSSSKDAKQLAYEYCNELITVPHSYPQKFSALFYRDLAQNLLSPLPYAISKYRSQKMIDEIRKCDESKQFDCVIADFLNVTINVPRTLKTAKVLFQHNVEAMIWKRHFMVQSHPLKKVYLWGQWKKMYSYEKRTCQWYDWVVAVSEDDRQIMKNEYDIEGVSDVATGVDIDYFRPEGQTTPEAFNMVFTGSMDWLPNEDAIKYFTEQIFPIIKRSCPQATLTVVGRNPYASLIELSKKDSSITVTGRVDDVRPYMERASAYVVPLRIGGGTRLKIYEAMAMQMPVISTTVGAEGLPVKDNEEILLADTPEEFATKVLSVLNDKNFSETLGLRAAETVRTRFGWSRVADQFEEICEEAIKNSSGPKM
jgi:polysaccharide biosynthesis protein PslH